MPKERVEFLRLSIAGKIHRLHIYFSILLGLINLLFTSFLATQKRCLEGFYHREDIDLEEG
jgi:hypothetical protein